MKAVLLDRSGIQQGPAVEPTPFVRRPAGVEMEVVDLGAALRRLLEGLGAALDRVAAVGVAGMAESGAPVDGGRAVGPILAWHDGRGEETVARLEGRFGDDLPRRIGQRARSVSSVAKLGWLLDHGLSPPQRWLGVPELCLCLLTGAEVTEHSLAARTGAYDVVAGDYMPEVAEFLGLRPGTFPPVARAGSVMGRVSPSAGRAHGLPTGIPVTVAGHDHLAAATGLGTAEGDLLNSVGTAETLLRRHPSPPDIERSLALGLAVTVWPGGDAWGVLASVTRSGLVVSALAGALGLEPAHLDRRAETAGAPGALAAGLAPWLEPRRTPGDPGPDLELPSGPPGAVWAAALRELSSRTVAAAARPAALLGPHRRMVVFGGGSRSRPWVAAKAAMAGVPVWRSTTPEATARGAALAAGVAAGWWPSPSAGPLPPLEPVVPQAPAGS